MILLVPRNGRGLLWLSTFAGLGLAGCDRAPPVDPDSLIACQPDGEATFERSCTVERAESPDGTILTLRHPDGRFRRLLVMKGGQGVAAADGAEVAEIRMSGATEIEVSLAGDRYQLPARPKAASAQ